MARRGVFLGALAPLRESSSVARIGKTDFIQAQSTTDQPSRAKSEGGGSNSARKYIFKQRLDRLSDSIGLPIRVVHYPPYCSKYNRIERRFFPHRGRACSGMLFDTVEMVVNLMRRHYKR